MPVYHFLIENLRYARSTDYMFFHVGWDPVIQSACSSENPLFPFLRIIIYYKD